MCKNVIHYRHASMCGLTDDILEMSCKKYE